MGVWKLAEVLVLLCLISLHVRDGLLLNTLMYRALLHLHLPSPGKVCDILTCRAGKAFSLNLLWLFPIFVSLPFQQKSCNGSNNIVCGRHSFNMCMYERMVSFKRGSLKPFICRSWRYMYTLTCNLETNVTTCTMPVQDLQGQGLQSCWPTPHDTTLFLQ